MKTTAQTLKQAEKLECELGILTEKFARSLQEPASRRDAQHLADSWLEITRVRPQMNSIGRVLRKIKKPVSSRMKIGDYQVQRQMYDLARGFKRRLRKWDEMERIVQRHLDPERKPLLPQSPMTGDDALLTQLYVALHRLANPRAQDTTAEQHGCFSDIALPIKSFDRLMSAAYRTSLAQNRQHAPRFLDVGCGGGTKVFAATRYFRQADGLEYDRGYADSARRTLQIIGASNSKIIHDDALNFDSYSDYDVIYFYRPLRDDALLQKMEQCIIRQARPGTILVAPHGSLLKPRPGIDCAQVEGPILVTGIGQSDADQLRHDAEATGTDILSRSTDLGFDAGYWAPILDAASFSGVEESPLKV